MNIKHLLSIGIITTLIGCSGGERNMESREAMADSASVLSSSAAMNNPQDSTHQFIRTADLKFKVRDVRKATTYVEDITAKYKGLVTYTIARELVENDRNLEEYQPSFLVKVQESAKEGWYILEALLLFFTKLWGIILLIVAGYFAYRKYAPRIQSKT